jgi:hypothetical protein
MLRSLDTYNVIKLKKNISHSESGITVCIATGYGLDDREVGVRLPVESRIFSSARRPDQLWGPRNLLPNEYQGCFSRGVKLATQLQLVQRSRKSPPIRLHGAVLS